MVFAILNTIVLLAYLADSLKARKRAGGILPIIAGVIVGALIVFYLGNTYSVVSLYFVLDFAALFAILPLYYMRNTYKLIVFLALILVEFFYVTYTYGSILYPFIQMFAVGTAAGVIYWKGLDVLKRSHPRSNKGVETRRDFVHVILGVVVLALFLSLKFYYAVYATIALIMLGYIYNSTLGDGNAGVVRKLLKSLEREGVPYGLGALYLGIGVALLLAFIHNTHFMIIGIAALMLADPIATIVGINIKGPKLFYNKKKSLYGTLAFLLTVVVLGYPFVGYYAILFGIGLAFVESVDSPVDDNIAIAVAMIALYIVFLALANQLPPIQLLPI
jgi:dolichol kinase